MTEPRHIRHHGIMIAPTPGWADQRLAQAFALIDDVITDPECAFEEARAELVRAADLIENADCLIEKQT